MVFGRHEKQKSKLVPLALALSIAAACSVKESGLASDHVGGVGGGIGSGGTGGWSGVGFITKL